jgi:MFS family permease
MGAAAFVSGLGLAPLLAAAFLLIAELAPAGTTTEAFAWLVTLFATGNALGSAVSGALVGGSLRAAALTAVGGIAAGAVLLLTTRRLLVPASTVGYSGSADADSGSDSGPAIPSAHSATVS